MNYNFIIGSRSATSSTRTVACGDIIVSNHATKYITGKSVSLLSDNRCILRLYVNACLKRTFTTLQFIPEESHL